MSSKDGFSVVAPTRMIVPSSMSGRKASCCARLKRWISSTKSSVPRPLPRRRRAASNSFLRSATPVKIALIWTKARSVASARSRAIVVFPTPGGPQKMIEPSAPSASIRPSGPSGPRRCSCPTTSSSRRGRCRSASGRGIEAGGAALPEARSKRSAITPPGGRAPDHSAVAASSAATRALSPAPLAAGSRSTNSMIAIGAMSP